MVSKEWETIFFSFAAEHEVPDGTGIAKIIVGDAQQTVEVADFQIYRLTVGYDVLNCPR